jgi:hypothetical protein
LSNDVRKVKIQLEGKNALHMREVQVLDCAGVNVAKGKTARQSSTWMSTTVTFSLNASSAVDGNLNTYSHTGFDQGKHQ